LNHIRNNIFNLREAREVMLRDVQRALLIARRDGQRTAPVLERKPIWIVTPANSSAAEKPSSENT
jgi:hypothetical protein